VPEEPDEANIDRALSFLKHRGLWIVLCVAIATAGAYGLSKRQTKQYTATTSIAFNNNPLSQAIAGLVTPTNSAILQQAGNLELLHLLNLSELTAARLGHGLTAASVAESISIGGQPESSIATVSATRPSPALAAKMANTYAQLFVTTQVQSRRRYFTLALAVVRKQLARLSPSQRIGNDGLALQNRAQSLTLLTELEPNSVQIAQQAIVPSAPSAPHTSRNVLIGAMLGLFIGFGIALLRERLDPRMRDPAALAAVYHVPLAGVVPRSSSLVRATRLNEESAPLPVAEAELFHMIRARLRPSGDERRVGTLLVTSAASEEGTTTVARHLAAAAARMGSRVILLEANLRHPQLAQQFGLESSPGLSEILSGEISVGAATHTVGVSDALGIKPGGAPLTVLSSGLDVDRNPVELLDSYAMDELLAQVKADYDLVVVDAPELDSFSDGFLLLSRVDGAILVGRVGRSRRDVAMRLSKTLHAARAPLLGLVANCAASKHSQRGGSASRQAAPRPEYSSVSTPAESRVS